MIFNRKTRGVIFRDLPGHSVLELMNFCYWQLPNRDLSDWPKISKKEFNPIFENIPYYEISQYQIELSKNLHCTLVSHFDRKFGFPGLAFPPVPNLIKTDISGFECSPDIWNKKALERTHGRKQLPSLMTLRVPPGFEFSLNFPKPKVNNSSVEFCGRRFFAKK